MNGLWNTIFNQKHVTKNLQPNIQIQHTQTQTLYPIKIPVELTEQSTFLIHIHKYDTQYYTCNYINNKKLV
jgi:hypothetical protein